MIDPGNGIHPNIPFSEYLKIPRLNNSDLRFMGVSPAHFLHNQTEKRKDTAALQRGRGVSLALFEPELFRSSYAVYEDRRAGKEWERFKEAMGPNVEILKPDQYELMKTIATAVRTSEMAKPFVTGGQGEVTICWTHTTPAVQGVGGYSLQCKGRLDFVPRNVFALSDVKSTRSAEPEAFSRQAFQLGYHVAGAWYQDAWFNLTGERRPFYLVAVEATPPHVVQVYELDEQALALGREVYRTRLDRLVICRSESQWPGYASAPMTLPIPKYLQDNDEQDLSELGLTEAA